MGANIYLDIFYHDYDDYNDGDVVILAQEMRNSHSRCHGRRYFRGENVIM